MKIAFASTGDGWNEKMDDRFGRAKGFFIYDTENETTKYLDNSNNNDMSHGAGTSAAKSIVDEGVKILVSAKVGPKAAEVLKVASVKIYNGLDNGILEEVYREYQNNGLEMQV